MYTYTMLCETPGPRGVISQASKFVLIAIIGLFLALVAQVVGLATNHWVTKGYGSSVYHTEGLWKECFCTASCYCYAREASADDRFLVTSVFETVGSIGLVAVLVMSIIGVCINNHRKIIKVATVVVCFLTSAVMFAGVVGVVSFVVPDPYLTLHYSFALCTIAAGFTLLCAFLLIVDIVRTPVISERTQPKEKAENQNQSRKKSDHRPTLGEYFNHRNVESEHGKAEYPGRRNQRTHYPKQLGDKDEFTSSENNYRRPKPSRRGERYAYENDGVDVSKNEYANRHFVQDTFEEETKNTSTYKNRTRHNNKLENQMVEPDQYAQMDQSRREYNSDDEYVNKYDISDQSENIATEVADMHLENQRPQNYSVSGKYKAQQETQPNKYSDQYLRKYDKTINGNEHNRRLEPEYESPKQSNQEFPRLRRSPNASDARRQWNLGPQYEAGSQTVERYENQSVHLPQKYRGYGNRTYDLGLAGPNRTMQENKFDHGSSQPIVSHRDRYVASPTTYSEATDQEIQYLPREWRGSSSETTV